MRYSVFYTQLHHDSRQAYRNLDVSCTIDEILGLAKCLVWRKLPTGSNQARSVKNVSRCCGRVRAVGFRPVYRVFFSRVRYLLSNLMSHVCLDRSNGSFTICIHTNSYDSIAFPLSNTVSTYWYFSETTQSFQLSSQPTRAAYGGWLETGGLTQVYTTKTTQITFFRLVQNRFWN